ncbi:MAG: class B sortase [Clostridia bacterium]|nr:class B sortase [Clostridia bacterium]
MEHRRRRPQGARIEQITPEIPQETEQGIGFAVPVPQADDQQIRMPEEQSAAPRRRRRPQTLENTPSEEENAAVQPAEAEKTAESERCRIQTRIDQIPQLPREDVSVKEETPARSIRRGDRTLQSIPKLPHQDVQTDEEEAEAPARAWQAKEKRKTTPEYEVLTQRQCPEDEDELQTAGGQAFSAVKTVLSGGKQALGYLGGALLLILMTAAEGISRLRGGIRNHADKRKSLIREDGHAPAKQEAFELEAIRPENYHGSARHRHERETERRSAARHAKEEEKQREGAAAGDRSARTRRAVRVPDMQQLMMIVFALVAVVSIFMIASILWRSVRTKMTNKKLTELYEQASENAHTPEETPEMIVFAPDESQQGEEKWPTDEMDEEYADEHETEWEEDDDALEAGGLLPEDFLRPTAVPMNKRVFHQVGGDALPQMEALHRENRDIVGWLKIENVLDLPVVYKDNSYYLTRDFYKQKNAAGTIFLDENHPFKEKTQNLLLHGHNMKDGTMFGRLVQYETDLNYVRWHPFVRFDTLWRNEEYVIFAVLRVSLDVKDDRFFNYFTHPAFSSDPEFESYIRQLQLRSIYAIPVDVKPTDALLTLSTCLDEDRLVIVARRVREGETHTQLRAITNLTTKQ